MLRSDCFFMYKFFFMISRFYVSRDACFGMPIVTISAMNDSDNDWVKSEGQFFICPQISKIILV